MRGHIRRRSDNSWSVVLYLGKGPDGRRKYKWQTVRGTKKDAQRELARLLHSFNTGSYVEPTRMSVAEFLERWLTDYAEANVETSTLDRYRIIVRRKLIPALGSLQLTKLQPMHIQAFYSEALKQMSGTTVVHYHRVLREALKHAVQWQLLVRNPADAVAPPRKSKPEFHVLTEAETAKLLTAARETSLYMPVVLAVATGMRRGEILGLKWSDVDLKAKRLTVRRSLERTISRGLQFKDPKSSRGRRSIPLPDFAVRALQAHKKAQAKQRLKLGPAYSSEDLVCATQNGSPVNPNHVTEAFRSLIKRTELPKVRFHDLRHGHATQLLAQNIHPKIVSERLGHATVSITLDLYSHVLPSMQEEAAERIDAGIQSAILANEK